MTHFTARVVERRDTERGPVVRLDRTAFYPTSGGQPHDTGTLGGVRVVDVWDDETGAVWHRLERPVEAEAAEGVMGLERAARLTRASSNSQYRSAGMPG